MDSPHEQDSLLIAMDRFLLLLFWVILMTVVIRSTLRISLAGRAKRSLRQRYEDQEALSLGKGLDGILGRWLRRAGYLDPRSIRIFQGAVIASFMIGVTAFVLLRRSDLFETGIINAQGIPGGVGDLAMPALLAGPWIVLVLFLAAPWLVVRAARRNRVTSIEMDLPIALELLATMAEAGLGFDAAMDRVLNSNLERRPLGMELRFFQQENRSGVPRIRTFRNLAARTATPSVSSFVSAMVQAEQSGAGISSVLRMQSDDLRNKRKENALRMAETLPVKLSFPLVICFLPGIFFVTMGPAFHQFFEMADTMVRGEQLP